MVTSKKLIFLNNMSQPTNKGKGRKKFMKVDKDMFKDSKFDVKINGETQNKEKCVITDCNNEAKKGFFACEFHLKSGDETQEKECKCVWCGRTYEEHDDARAVGSPVPKTPCLLLKSGFVARKQISSSKNIKVNEKGNLVVAHPTPDSWEKELDEVHDDIFCSQGDMVKKFVRELIEKTETDAEEYAFKAIASHKEEWVGKIKDMENPFFPPDIRKDSDDDFDDGWYKGFECARRKILALLKSDNKNK